MSHTTPTTEKRKPNALAKTASLLLLALLPLLPTAARAQEADSVDVLDYDLSLDLSAEANILQGKAVITLLALQPLTQVELQSYFQTDSILVDGTAAASWQTPGYQRLLIPVGQAAAGDTLRLTVFYHGGGHVESYGWGGLHMDADMRYNLGVAFNENPHTVGRTLFPCRDLFTDKATYTLRVTSRPGWTAQCGGILQSRTSDSDGREHTVWRISHPTPTYLVSVATAAWHTIETTVQGLADTYPLTLGFTTQDSALVAASFAELDSVVPMFERCFGPYRWGRIGYIATQQGSMEHVNNIALDRTFVAAPNNDRGQSTIAHELGHAWFGNLITCAGEEDMWINEGGASFCAEVAKQAVQGRAAAVKYYQTSLSDVIRHDEHRPLSPMPHSATYGSTTYDKGALVWHSLRGYLGDSLFYASMRRLMERAAFGNVSAASLRDSLSLYSGRDLTDFFDFHVLSPGFVDYRVEALPDPADANHVSLRVDIQGFGTTRMPRSHRIPVTFFSGWADEGMKVWFDFDSTACVGDHFVLDTTLPFAPTFAILDRDCELSDAATLVEYLLQGPDQRGAALAFATVSSGALAAPTRVAVEHHWGQPAGLADVPGVVRPAHRYWMVRMAPDATAISGGFYASRTDNTNDAFVHLDDGFYLGRTTTDSLRLMYRPSSAEAWRPVTVQWSGTVRQPHFAVNPMLPGEYALAVVDTAVLAATGAALQHSSLNLFPNPLPAGATLNLNLPGIEGPLTLTVFDSTGRVVLRREGVLPSMPLALGLPAGRYLVQIENKCVSLQSNLIQL